MARPVCFEKNSVNPWKRVALITTYLHNNENNFFAANHDALKYVQILT